MKDNKKPHRGIILWDILSFWEQIHLPSKIIFDTSAKDRHKMMNFDLETHYS